MNNKDNKARFEKAISLGIVLPDSLRKGDPRALVRYAFFY
jgi:hypothetical protein